MPIRKRKRKKWWIIPLVLVALLVGAFFYGKKQFAIKKINITGSDKYTYDELYNYIFKDRNDKNMILFKHSDKRAPEIKIPFIAKVVMETKWPDTINITVYEKSMVGYIVYQGAYMYFDKDGVVVESSNQIVDGVPLVTGLNFNHIVLYETLDVPDESVFNSILDLKQYLDKYDIVVEKISVSENSTFSIRIGDITVLLGKDDTYMSEKIYEISCMMEQFDGRKGTLDMEDYNEDSQYIILTEDK